MFNSANDPSHETTRRTLAIWLTLGIAVSIGILTLIPMSMEPSAPGSDKTHHFLAFAALVLPCAALYPKGLFKGALAAALYGGLIEVIQPYVGRTGEIADFVADLGGIGAGGALGLVFHFILRRIFGAANQRPDSGIVRSEP